MRKKITALLRDKKNINCPYDEKKYCPPKINYLIEQNVKYPSIQQHNT